MTPIGPDLAREESGGAAPRAARKPHIVIVGHLAGAELYGAERSLLALLAAIDRARYRATCLLPAANEDYLRRIAALADDVAVLPYGWWSATRPSDGTTVARFERIFREGRADLVHVNTITLMDPLIAARSARVPSIVHAREIVSEDHELADHLGGDAATIIETVKDAADFIIANSDAAHRVYRKEGRSFRLYNCVDVDALDLPNEVAGGGLRIGIISSNLPKKGIAQFVALARLAAARRPAFEFVVVGPRNGYVENLARRAGDHVNLRLAGYADGPAAAVRQVNVVVSFSTVPELFGRTLAEGMAARRPVIAHDLGAAREIVRHGVDGFIVAPGDIEGALAHIESLADDPTRFAAMGAAGRARVAERFAPAAFAAGLEAIYRRILPSAAEHAS